LVGIFAFVQVQEQQSVNQNGCYQPFDEYERIDQNAKLQLAKHNVYSTQNYQTLEKWRFLDFA